MFCNDLNDLRWLKIPHLCESSALSGCFAEHWCPHLRGEVKKKKQKKKRGKQNHPVNLELTSFCGCCARNAQKVVRVWLHFVCVCFKTLIISCNYSCLDTQYAYTVVRSVMERWFKLLWHQSVCIAVSRHEPTCAIARRPLISFFKDISVIWHCRLIDRIKSFILCDMV